MIKITHVPRRAAAALGRPSHLPARLRVTEPEPPGQPLTRRPGKPEGHFSSTSHEAVSGGMRQLRSLR